MSPLEKAIRRETGYADVIRPDPKPARWNRSLRSARLYANQWAREWAKMCFPRCVTCGSRETLEWAHVLSGKGDAVRWHKQNMTRQCQRCNQLHEEHPEHLVAWFVRTYGSATYVRLTITANRTVKYSYADIIRIGDELRADVKEGIK